RPKLEVRGPVSGAGADVLAHLLRSPGAQDVAAEAGGVDDVSGAVVVRGWRVGVRTAGEGGPGDVAAAAAALAATTGPREGDIAVDRGDVVDPEDGVLDRGLGRGGRGRDVRAGSLDELDGAVEAEQMGHHATAGAPPHLIDVLGGGGELLGLADRGDGDVGGDHPGDRDLQRVRLRLSLAARGVHPAREPLLMDEQAGRDIYGRLGAEGEKHDGSPRQGAAVSLLVSLGTTRR